MTEPHHSDELTQRYREASAEDTRRPSEHVRQAVRAHAQMVIAAGSQNAAKPDAPRAAAANHSRWKISVLASVALAGLTGLLVLQFDRGTPQEQEVALGRPGAGTSPTPSASPSLPSPPSSPPYPASRETTAKASPPAAPPLVTTKPARSAADSNASHAGQSLRKAVPPPPAEPSAAPAPEARPAAPSSARLADAAAPSEAPPVAQSSHAGVPAPASAPAMRAAPAARAPATEKKQDGLALQAPRLRAEAGSNQGLTAALHEAARSGRVSEAERLLQQGAPLNAPDEAGRTPLILAVIHGHAAMVQRLMALGANPALVDQGGLTALQHARRLGLDRIASLIEAGS